MNSAPADEHAARRDALDDIDRAVDLVAGIDAVTAILDVVCRVTRMGFAAVARVTDDRWIACQVLDEIEFGLRPGGELDVETTLCREVHHGRQVVAFDDAQTSEHYCGHPTPKLYGFRSYISVPIVLADGRFFGTLCAIDPQPAQVDNPTVVEMFRLFAELIAMHLGAIFELESSRTALADAQATATLRERFIAMVGHDLRNPLNAVLGGVGLLERYDLEAGARRVVAMIARSVGRMSTLLDDLYDFARGRLGGGLALTWCDDQTLDEALQQVVEELSAIDPERELQTEVDVEAGVECDVARIAQLASNLIGNAMRHGDPEHPVVVRAVADDSHFELTVVNQGPAIPADRRERMFEPFARASTQGLGLGLYIADEIATAHGGTLAYTSNEAQTCFTFRMPARRTR